MKKMFILGYICLATFVFTNICFAYYGEEEDDLGKIRRRHEEIMKKRFVETLENRYTDGVIQKYQPTFTIKEASDPSIGAEKAKEWLFNELKNQNRNIEIDDIVCLGYEDVDAPKVDGDMRVHTQGPHRHVFRFIIKGNDDERFFVCGTYDRSCKEGAWIQVGRILSSVRSDEEPLYKEDPEYGLANLMPPLPAKPIVSEKWDAHNPKIGPVPDGFTKRKVEAAKSDEEPVYRKDGKLIRAGASPVGLPSIKEDIMAQPYNYVDHVELKLPEGIGPFIYDIDGNGKINNEDRKIIGAKYPKARLEVLYEVNEKIDISSIQKLPLEISERIPSTSAKGNDEIITLLTYDPIVMDEVIARNFVNNENHAQFGCQIGYTTVRNMADQPETDIAQLPNPNQ